MYQDCDVIILSLIKWDGPVSSTPYALAKEFARSNRVFYINHPVSVKDAFNEQKIRAGLDNYSVLQNYYIQPDNSRPDLVAVTPCLTLPINFLPDGRFYDLMSLVNEWMVFSLLKRLIKDQEIKKYIFINAFDPYFARRFPSAMLQPEKKIYYSLDDISEVSYTAKHGIRLEKEMSHNYDLVLASSTMLYKKLASYTSRAFLLPNGADTVLFSRAQSGNYTLPDELRTFAGKKVIGYVGSLEYRTDIPLLNAIADNNPDKVLCLVGPVFSDEALSSGLFQKPNVVWCGRKPIEELPLYLHFMHCMIIPFKCNKLTSSIYPLKINEYLAAGKPVVSTGFSTEIHSFGDLIGIATGTDSFNELINHAISTDTPELAAVRMLKVHENSWTNRVSQFWKILNQPVTAEIEETVC